MKFRSLAVSMLVLAFVVTLTPSAATPARAQANPPPAPGSQPLPPVANAYSIPRQVIYLSPFPGERSVLMVEGYKSVDPLGRGLTYAFDGDGDGRFEPFGIVSATNAVIGVAGPFNAAMRIQDAEGRVAGYELPMVARQFSVHYVDVGELFWPSVASVAGRPAVAYQEINAGLKFAINSQADGSGAWDVTMALPSPNAVCPCRLGVLLGRPVIAYTDPDSESAAIVVNDRADGSGEWRSRLVVGPTTLALSSLLESGGLVMMSYWQEGRWLGLHGTTSLLDEARWDAPLPSFELGQSPWGENALALVGDPAERPAIVYLKQGAGLTISVASKPDWVGGSKTVTIPGTTGAFAPSLVMLHTGPAVAFRDYSTGKLMFAAAKTMDGLGEWSLQTVYPSGRGGAPWVQQLALVDGRPAIAFESDKKGIVFGYNSEENGSGTWSFTLLERSGNGGQNPSLAVVAGRPVVAFVSANKAGIVVATAR